MMDPESEPLDFGTHRERDEFAWLPVRLDDPAGLPRPWYHGWIHLSWYRVTDRLDEDYSGWSAGIWRTVARRPGPGHRAPTVYAAPTPASRRLAE